jgi:hypothetical protein
MQQMDVQEEPEELRLFWHYCICGQLEQAVHLLSLARGLNIHADSERSSRFSCARGQLQVAQWLHSLGAVDVHAEHDEAFRNACWGCHEGVVRWLHSLGGVDVHAYDDFVFRFAAGEYGKPLAMLLKSLHIVL